MFSSLFDAITSNVAAVPIGQKQAIELAVICLLADGHLLIEDVPGVGKTKPGQGTGRIDRVHLETCPVHPGHAPR